MFKGTKKSPVIFRGLISMKDENYFLINFTFSTFPLSSTEMM